MRLLNDDGETGVYTKCDECADECSTRVIDNGIGAFEYWGAVGFDSQPVRVSSCCEADFTCYDVDEEVEA